LSLKFY